MGKGNFVPRGHLAVSIMIDSTRECYCLKWSEAKNAAKIPYNAQLASPLTNKELSSSNTNSAKVAKPLDRAKWKRIIEIF